MDGWIGEDKGVRTAFIGVLIPPGVRGDVLGLLLLLLVAALEHLLEELELGGCEGEEEEEDEREECLQHFVGGE